MSRSACLACCNARSRVTVTTALYCGPRVSRRARNVSASSTGDPCRVCTRVCNSRMDMQTTGLVTKLALLAIGDTERERFSAIVEPDGSQRRRSLADAGHALTHFLQLVRGQAVSVTLPDNIEQCLALWRGLAGALQRPVQAFRGHRQLLQPDAYGPVDGIRYGRRRWHDGDLPNSANTVGVVTRRLFDDIGANAWDVQAGRHTVIEQVGVLQHPLVVKGIPLGQSPANALSGPALHLAFDLIWIDTQTHVLKRRVLENGDGAGVTINLNIGNMHRCVRRNRHRAKGLAIAAIAHDGVLATYRALRDVGQPHGAIGRTLYPEAFALVHNVLWRGFQGCCHTGF